jgi:SlyX protein
MALEDRVTELETRLAFQDDTLSALNDELVHQQRALERLQLQMAALVKRQEEMVGQFEISTQDAPPPHY